MLTRDVSVCASRERVFVNDVPLELTAQQERLIKLFLRCPDQKLEIDDIRRAISNSENKRGKSTLVKVQVCLVRKLIGSIAPKSHEVIRTDRRSQSYPDKFPGGYTYVPHIETRIEVR